MMQFSSCPPWSDFSFKTMELLRRGPGMSCLNPSRVFQLLICGSFTNPQSWTVFDEKIIDGKLGSGNAVEVLLETWESNRDSKPLCEEDHLLERSSPENDEKIRELLPDHPTIESGTYYLDKTILEHFLRSVTELSVSPITPLDIDGLDGVTYELSFGHAITGSRFFWHNAGPKEWRPLIEVAFLMLRELERLV